MVKRIINWECGICGSAYASVQGANACERGGYSEKIPRGLVFKISTNGKSRIIMVKGERGEKIVNQNRHGKLCELYVLEGARAGADGKIRGTMMQDACDAEVYIKESKIKVGVGRSRIISEKGIAELCRKYSDFAQTYHQTKYGDSRKPDN